MKTALVIIGWILAMALCFYAWGLFFGWILSS